MFDSTYEVFKVSRLGAFGRDFHKEVLLYRFDAKEGERYLIYVTEYPENFFTIDFCRNKSRNSKNKWTEISGLSDAVKVLSTVTHLMIDLLKAGYEEGVCFGFIGARMDSEEDQETSKRFRVYRKIMLNLIDRNAFYHLEDPSIDAYLIVNPKADLNKVLTTARHAFAKENEEE
ncbi:hypothetical protein QWY85_03935 [Neolewinella lacunae]|uniref:Uncharacterized protein n=1 Tax=Neolewinella lacunae TaxID=1517758 RepID=A0A923PLR9_9BACT|nr:hypothetical protein [Neolewinella lacunae]MBC6992842.1 hypothetical protein [Neolewinella lacunae]MDN3633794.1 hypothetical protein [Neolewinella lacunae]